MSGEYYYPSRRDITAEDIRSKNPIATRAWDFDSDFKRIFEDGSTNKRPLIGKPRKYNRNKKELSNGNAK